MKKIIKSIYSKANNKFKNVLEKLIVKYENGEFWSQTLREIYKENYNVEIGVGSYGCFKQDKYKYIKKIGNYTSIASRVRIFSKKSSKKLCVYASDIL